jgi:hypothetical protein
VLSEGQLAALGKHGELQLIGRAILNAIWPDRFGWQVVAITGGIGLIQLVTASSRSRSATSSKI